MRGARSGTNESAHSRVLTGWGARRSKLRPVRDYAIALIEWTAETVAHGLVAKHRRAASRSEKIADRHTEAALYWRERGEDQRADLEVQSAALERKRAQLECLRAELVEQAPAGVAKPGFASSRPAFSTSTVLREKASSIPDRIMAALRLLWRAVHETAGMVKLKDVLQKLRDSAALELAALVGGDTVRRGTRSTTWSWAGLALVCTCLAFGIAIGALLE
jgi:hypothetical protein